MAEPRTVASAGPAAQAGDKTTIIRIFGTVQYRMSPSDSWKIATEGLALPDEAELRTGIGASVRFRLKNGRVARLLSIASVKIEDANLGKTSRRLEYDPPETTGSGSDPFAPRSFPPAIWDSAFEQIMTLQDDASLLGGGDDNSLLSPAPAAPADGDDNSLLSAPPASGDDNSLLGTPPASDDDSSLLGDTPEAPGSSTPAAQPPNVPAAEPRPADERVRAGGWFRDDIAFALRYRPTGHADAFLRAWTTLGLAAADRPERDPLRDLGVELSKPTAAGTCAKCHSIDAIDGSASLYINWQPERRDLRARSFNRFAHAPHLIQTHLRTCIHCHDMSSEGGYLAAFEGHDPHTFTPSFRPIAASVCADCHRPEAANASCLNCHNYHVGGSLTELPSFSPVALPQESR